jgi:hypothetical protein
MSGRETCPSRRRTLRARFAAPLQAAVTYLAAAALPYSPALLATGAAVVIGGAVIRFAPTPAVADDDADEGMAPDPAVAQANLKSRARDLVAREVAAGRMTLPDAAAAFDWFDHLPPLSPAPLPWQASVGAGVPPDPGYTQTEILALRVVTRVDVLERTQYPAVPAGSAEAARGQSRRARAGGALTCLPAVPDAALARLLAVAAARTPGATFRCQ